MNRNTNAKLDRRLMGTWLAMLLIVAFIGCYPGPAGRLEPSPLPVDSRVAEAAAKCVPAYGAALAAEADETTRKAEAGEYADWAAAFDDWESRNKAARVKAFGQFESSLNDGLGLKETDGEGPAFDATKLAEVAREAAKGFRQ